MRRLARDEHGFMLVEVIVYVAVFAVVMVVAYTAVTACMRTSAAFRRNCDDVQAALRAGEAWRDEVRSARSVSPTAGGGIALTTGADIAEYRLRGSDVERRPVAGKPWTVVLGRVKSSRFVVDKRRSVTAWRWEIEIEGRKGPACVRPLFTFIAVPSGGGGGGGGETGGAEEAER